MIKWEHFLLFRFMIKLLWCILVCSTLLIVLYLCISIMGFEFAYKIKYEEFRTAFRFLPIGLIVLGVVAAILTWKHKAQAGKTLLFVLVLLAIVISSCWISYGWLFSKYKAQWIARGWDTQQFLSISEDRILYKIRKNDEKSQAQIVEYLRIISESQLPLSSGMQEFIKSKISSAQARMIEDFDLKRRSCYQGINRPEWHKLLYVPQGIIEDERRSHGFPFLSPFVRIMLLKPAYNDLTKMDQWGIWIRSVPCWEKQQYAWHEAKNLGLNQGFYYAPFNLEYCGPLIIHAQHRMLELTNLIMNFRTIAGALPKNIAELKCEIPLDPFGPFPLRYKYISEGSFVVYSVGPDEIDNHASNLYSGYSPPVTLDSLEAINRPMDIGFEIKLLKRSIEKK